PQAQEQRRIDPRQQAGGQGVLGRAVPGAGQVTPPYCPRAEWRVAPQGTVVMLRLAQGPEVASVVALAAWERPIAAGGSAGSTARASSTHGPSGPPHSPASARS